MFWGGQCCETSAVLFMPVLDHFGRFSAFSRQNGPTDRPADERPVKRKFGKNNRTPGQWSFGNPEYPRGGQKRFLNGRKRIFEKLLSFFW